MQGTPKKREEGTWLASKVVIKERDIEKLTGKSDEHVHKPTRPGRTEDKVKIRLDIIRMQTELSNKALGAVKTAVHEGGFEGYGERTENVPAVGGSGERF